MIVWEVTCEEFDTSSDPYDPLDVPNATFESELRSVDHVIVAFFVVIDPDAGPEVSPADVKYLPVGVLVTVEETAEQLLAESHAFMQ